MNRTPGEWIDAGEGRLAHPVSGGPVLTRIVEAKGFGRIGEWHDYSNEPEGNFQAILRAVNCHEELISCCTGAREVLLGLHTLVQPLSGDDKISRLLSKLDSTLAKAKGVQP